MNPSTEWIAISTDEDWNDKPDFWSFAERNHTRDLVDAINMMKLEDGQGYWIHIRGASEDGSQPASVLLQAQRETGIGQDRLQVLADTMCRLLRPARFEVEADEDDPSEAPQVYSFFTTTPVSTAHERIQALACLNEIARDIGRSDEGIEAALDELSKWDLLPAGAPPERMTA
jgi:hypothetical protein